jgi:hypothetical protein
MVLELPAEYALPSEFVDHLAARLLCPMSGTTTPTKEKIGEEANFRMA